MAIEATLLRHLSPRLTESAAQEIAAALTAGAAMYRIDNNRRVAAFLGQCCHESAGFTVAEENLRYRPEVLLRMFPYSPRRVWGFVGLQDAEEIVVGGARSIANRIYGSRMGNDPATNDGYDFRGSGYIQLTGRDAFHRYEEDAGEGLVADPGQARKMPHAAMSACWVFASWKRCNPMADAWEIGRIGTAINGANPPNGAAERVELSDKALELLGGG